MPCIHPPVSIIVTIYNMEDYLEQCLDSIISQSFPEIEILLVDDGSTDRSLEICNQYDAQDDRITIIHQENAGVSEARNKGLQAVTGDWIMFVDGDDWLTPDAVEILFKSAAFEDNCDIVAGAYYENYPPPIERELFIGSKSLPNNSIRVDLNLYKENIICYALTGRGFPELTELTCNLRTPWAKLYRRLLLIDNEIAFIPGLDKGEDRIFNLYVLNAANNLLSVNVPVYHSRFRFDSLSRKFTGTQALSDPVVIWAHKVREFLDQFPNLSDDVYAGFLFSVLKAAADFCFKGYLSGSLSRREAAKNMRLLFHQDIYREMLQTAYTGRRSTYFSARDRFVLVIIRLQRYAMFLILRHRDFYRDIKQGPQPV